MKNDCLTAATVVPPDPGAAGHRHGDSSGDAGHSPQLLLEGQQVRGGRQRGRVAPPLHDG